MKCTACQGKGKLSHPYLENTVGTCQKCKGTGTMPDEQLQDCPTCDGSGSINIGPYSESKMCNDCTGTGKRTVKVDIPEVVGPTSITEMKPPEWKGPIQVKQESTTITKQTQHQANIETFMRGAQQELPKVPTQPSPKDCVLRSRLILEEALETIAGLGVRVWVGYELLENPRKGVNKSNLGSKIVFDTCGTFDMVEVADGCADISVVTIGTLSACGIKDHALLEEVDKSNTAKIEGGHKDEHGKWIKPANWTAPDIMSILKSQGYQPPEK